jgi:hypothetical protein
VKRKSASWAPKRLAPVVALGASLGSVACGYRPVYGGEGAERLRVVLARAPVADAAAADEVVSGVREELAREGALASGDGYPRIEIEVTRLDEASDAIAAVGGASGIQVPAARATEVGVVARAWLVRVERGEHERDTGDVRVFVVTGATQAGEATPSASPAALDALRFEDALRAAGRRTGIRLARRLLGEPAPAEDVEGEWKAPAR